MCCAIGLVNWQLTGGLAGLGAVFIFLFFPETLYFRNLETPPQELQVDDFTEKGHVTSADRSPAPSQSDNVASNTTRKSFFQELKPWSQINPNTSFLELLFRPWPLIVYPAAIYTLLVFSSTLAWSLCVLNTNASIFQKAPYNFSPGINSLIKIPPIIGTIFGVYLGGALTDQYVQWRARKNNGIFEPEMRLAALILPFFVVPAGILMYYSPSQNVDV
jgi:hypothetical protein